MRMPSNRNLYLVYRVRGRLGQNHGEPTIWVSEGTPEVLVTARALDGTFRTWEGTVSRRLTDHSFDIDERVPVRIDLDRLEPLSNLAEWSSGTLADGERFDLVGRVSNLHEAVRAADGTCIPATDALGTADPFAGATEDRIALRRIAGMHITGDQVIVVQYPSGTAGLSQTGMTGLLLHHPAGLLQGEPAPDWTEHEFWPHGTPNGHTLSIHPVVGGGGSCP